MRRLWNAGFPGKQMSARYNTNFRGRKRKNQNMEIWNTEYGNILNKVNLGNCNIYSFGI